MSKTYERIDETLAGFIKAQKMFFVATAPLSGEGSVNVSPKGYDSLALIDERTVAYLDLGGSGAETLAHVRENGRITLMFCAFEGAANILRLYGRGRAVAFSVLVPWQGGLVAPRLVPMGVAQGCPPPPRRFPQARGRRQGPQ